MRIILPLLALLLAACQAGPTASPVANVCDMDENLLGNPGFARDEGTGSLRPWAGSQHAGEPSFATSVDAGVLTIEKIATQPWFKFSQAPGARTLSGLSQQL